MRLLGTPTGSDSVRLAHALRALRDAKKTGAVSMPPRPFRRIELGIIFVTFLLTMVGLDIAVRGLRANDAVGAVLALCTLGALLYGYSRFLLMNNRRWAAYWGANLEHLGRYLSGEVGDPPPRRG